MAFQNRTEFTTAQSSEKITLAHIEARKRLLPWTLDSGTIYVKDVNYYVIRVHNGLTELTEVASKGAMTTDTWFYDHLTNKLYIDVAGDPASEEIIATFRLFYSSSPVDATHDLTGTGKDVHYNGRITLAPPYKHKIGVQQNLVSIIGNGSIKLINTDGALDEIYDTLIFDNQQVFIYSWSRDLPISDHKIIYRGRVVNKRFQTDFVTFQVKDQLVDLEQNVPQTAYDDTDTVTDSVKGTYKRWVYGRVDGLKLQSIDQIGEGYTITGTLTASSPTRELTEFNSIPAASSFPASGAGEYFTIYNADDSTKFIYWFNVDSGNTQPSAGDGTYVPVDVGASDTADVVKNKLSDALDDNFTIVSSSAELAVENFDTGETTNATDFNTGILITVAKQGVSGKRIIGTGTSFLSDVSPGDKLIVGSQEFTIDRVDDDTNLYINQEASAFFQQPGTLVPEVPTTSKNREFFVADHASAKLTKTLTQILQFNRVVLSDSDGIEAGDFLEFATGERVEVENVLNGTVTLVQNLIQLPAISSSVTRQPVQQVFIEKDLAFSDDYTIFNAANTRIVFETDAEFNLATTDQLGFSATFTNGTRSITTADTIDLREILKPRDWIRPSDLSYTTFYEILAVDEQEITIRTNFTDPTITDEAEGKKPNYIGDDTIISANVLGRTEDGTAAGTWITTAAQAMRDLIKEAGITNVNETSFTDGELANQHLISMALPFEPAGGQVTYKQVIDRLARSTNSVMTLDNDLQLKYKVLNAEWPDDPLEINDFDVIKWDIETISGKNIRNSLVNYRFQDIERFTQESGNKTVYFSSDYVEKYVGTNNTDEVDIYLYNQDEAEIVAHRNTYLQTLGRSDISIETDLRLENVEIGDVIVLDFARMYKRFGDETTRKKAAIVIGKTLNGERTKLELTDFGNIFNRSSIITPNSAPDWTAASIDEKLKYGYITDEQGIVNDEEDTMGTHLIS